MGFPDPKDSHGVELRVSQYTNLCGCDVMSKLSLIFSSDSKWTNFKPPAANGAPISIVAHPITGGNSDDVVFTANIIEYVNLN